MADETKKVEIQYTDAKALMAHGPRELHDHISSKVEVALGKSLPQMEVRVKNLSIHADVTVVDDGDAKSELPTIANHLKKSFSKVGAKKRVVKKQILSNVNSVFKPGTITLLLGQPGSGKSSLMKILSGRFPQGKNVHVEGEMTYNGTTQNELLKRLPQFVSYVTQRDKHFPTLTVKETLEFAHACCGGELSERAESHLANGTPEENKIAIEAARALYKHYPDIVIQQLGLDNCQDTIVGDAMLRGVSGGERKRVTTGEMQFGNKYVTFMDEISTGLDSAATFDIITTQRSIAKKFRKTIVIALLQPSPEVFALFDDVMILNEGHVMYHGPREQIVGYFRDLGFVCPPRRDVADFLLDLGTEQQYQYQVEMPGKVIPRRASDFADVFMRSSVHDAMLADLHGPYDPVLLHDKEKHVDPLPQFHQGFWESTRTLMARQTKVTMRNTAFLKGRALMVIIMGLLYASVFYQFDVKDAQVVMGIIFSAILFLSLGQASQIPTFLAAREVFYKQRGANFFRTASYVLSSSVSQLPLALMESVLFGTLVYWMCGFVPTAGAYLIYELMLFLTNLAFAAWFFFLLPLLHVARSSRGEADLDGLCIPDYFIWIYWINPIAWCVRSLAVNQYRNERFEECTYEGVDYCGPFGKKMGEYSLSLFDVPSEKEWVWYGAAFMVFSYVFFMFLSFLALEYHRFESPENITIGGSDEDATTDEYGIMQTPKGSPSGSTVILEVNEQREKNFIPVTVAFKDLWYSVPDPSNPKETIDLLKGISGFAHPGTMTALMGSSGAGKTTLMDVIAGRKTGGQIRGQILLNGYEATDLAIRRCTGYCEQMDIHSEASTIREALTFSAFLRQSADVPDSKKFDSVNECLDLLDLNPIADQIIRGSSVEQMKRLTIGVELAAQPSVIFLDEPTSGLDARSAKVIMDGVRKVANTGRTIVCTIHQPSTEVFMLFDSLLLLKRGGETVFFGDLGKNASELIKYFERVESVAPLEDGYNPATWMLEVIGAGVGNTSGQETDFVALFKASENKALLDAEMEKEGVSRPSPLIPALEFGSKRAATEATQMKFLVKRFLDMYWRTPSYNLTRFIISLILALLFGLVFIDAEYKTYQGINAGAGMVFMTTVFIGLISFNSVLPIASEERASFYRERASQTYNALWYFVGSTVAEIPYVFISSFLFTAVFFPMVGFTGVSRFFFYWLNTSLHVLLQTYIGQFLSYALPSVEVAAIIGVLLNSIFFLFMGFNPPGDAIPTGYKWLYYITPQKYTLSILTSIVFGDCGDDTSEIGCQAMLNTPPTMPAGMTVKQYIESVFLMKHSDIWRDFFVIIAFIVLFRVLAALSLRYINHQKR
ncbi:Atp-binding protein, partial [Globisporangium splendens]